MPIVKLGDVAKEHKETRKGDKGDLPVVGLEHLIPEDVNLTCWSDDKENTFTKMFRKGHVLFGRRRAYLKKAAVAPFDGICSGDITVIEAIEEKLYPGLKDAALRFGVFQRLEYLLHIPVSQMKKENRQYQAVVLFMRKNWYLAMKNPYLTGKNKLYYTLFALVPKGIRRLHRIKMKIQNH